MTGVTAAQLRVTAVITALHCGTWHGHQHWLSIHCPQPRLSQSAVIVVTIAKCLDSDLPQSSHLAALRCISTHWKLYRHIYHPISHHLAEQLSIVHILYFALRS